VILKTTCRPSKLLVMRYLLLSIPGTIHLQYYNTCTHVVAEDRRQIGGGWDVKTILLINYNKPHCTEWPLSPQRCREHIYFAVGGTVIVIGKIQEYNTHVIRVIDFNYSYIFHSHDTNKTLTVKPSGNVNIITYQVSIDTFYDVELRKNKKK
jgi:hypothetical protein